jgi:hypothetical protein
VYNLVTTPEYDAELADIGPDPELSQELERTLYTELRRTPRAGERTRTGAYVIRRKLLMGLLLVQVAYLVDRRRQTITLVSIRDIDQTRL